MGLLNFIKDLFKDDGVDINVGQEWELLETDDDGNDMAPRWVIKALNNYEQRCVGRPYNHVKHFVGRTFVYKVYFKMISQGHVEPIIWRKLKRKKKRK